MSSFVLGGREIREENKPASSAPNCMHARKRPAFYFPPFPFLFHLPHSLAAGSGAPAAAAGQAARNLLLLFSTLLIQFIVFILPNLMLTIYFVCFST
jgi:hypothetical protein